MQDKTELPKHVLVSVLNPHAPNSRLQVEHALPGFQALEAARGGIQVARYILTEIIDLTFAPVIKNQTVYCIVAPLSGRISDSTAKPTQAPQGESEHGGDRFFQHVRDCLDEHGREAERVVCKVCGKTGVDIIDEARGPEGGSGGSIRSGRSDR